LADPLAGTKFDLRKFPFGFRIIPDACRRCQASTLVLLFTSRTPATSPGVIPLGLRRVAVPLSSHRWEHKR
jgi:hypothetical protein